MRKPSKSYAAGYVFSILLTLIAYFFTVDGMFSSNNLIFAIVCLALIQVFIQLVFFLHINVEKRPRWNLLIFFSTVSVILIVVIGSLWIMSHLNYNMMPQEMDQHLLEEEGFDR